jgi:hypothetical protein
LFRRHRQRRRQDGKPEPLSAGHCSLKLPNRVTDYERTAENFTVGGAISIQGKYAAEHNWTAP